MVLESAALGGYNASVLYVLYHNYVSFAGKKSFLGIIPYYT
jgi:hypothetical protein